MVRDLVCTYFTLILDLVPSEVGTPEGGELADKVGCPETTHGWLRG
jgi:hypothetical protein